jgi:flavin reductase (DIM6/NTAB) family NADH-FMN oxidoreductase RutF
LSWHATEGGALLLNDATAWLDCAVEETVRAGDHDIVLFRVHRHRVHADRGPLVFHASGFYVLSDLEHAS